MKVAASLHVDTPEGVALELPLASIGERTTAALIDFGLILLGYLAAVAFLDPLHGDLWLVLAGFGLRHGYFLLFETLWHGVTPGKRLLRIVVVTHDGSPLTGSAVVLRNLLRDTELFFPFYVLARPEALVGAGPGWLHLFALGWVVLFSALALVHPQRRRLGDVVAGTVVIRRPAAGLASDEATGASSTDWHPGTLGIYGAFELDRLAALLREVDPGTEAGHVLLARVARTIATRIGLPPDTTAWVVTAPEPFLRDFYRAQRAHLERQLLFGRYKPDKHTPPEPVDGGEASLEKHSLGWRK